MITVSYLNWAVFIAKLSVTSPEIVIVVTHYCSTILIYEVAYKGSKAIEGVEQPVTISSYLYQQDLPAMTQMTVCFWFRRDMAHDLSHYHQFFTIRSSCECCLIAATSCKYKSHQTFWHLPGASHIYQEPLIFTRSLSYLPGASRIYREPPVFSQSDFGAKITVISFLMFFLQLIG